MFSVGALCQSHLRMLAPHTRVCSQVNTVHARTRTEEVMEEFLSLSPLSYLCLFHTLFVSAAHSVYV